LTNSLAGVRQIIVYSIANQQIKPSRSLVRYNKSTIKITLSLRKMKAKQ